MRKRTRLEEIALAQPEATIRIALFGAVRYAIDHQADFEEQFGMYGGEGLEALVKERKGDGK